MINIYYLLAQMTKEEVNDFYFFLQDMKVSSPKVDEIRNELLTEIQNEFPD